MQRDGWLKNLKVTKSFQQSPFIRKVRERPDCCKLVGVRSFVPEVRSGSGNNVLVNLYQMNVILSSDKKKQGPKAKLSPSGVLVLAKRR